MHTFGGLIAQRSLIRAFCYCFWAILYWAEDLQALKLVLQERKATSRQLRRIAGDRKVDIHSKLMVFGNSTIPVIGCKYTRLKKRKNVESNHKLHKPDDMSIIWVLLSTFGKHAARILPVPDDIVIECLIVILWKSTKINHYSACFWIGNQKISRTVTLRNKAEVSGAYCSKNGTCEFLASWSRNRKTLPAKIRAKLSIFVLPRPPKWHLLSIQILTLEHRKCKQKLDLRLAEV